MPDTPVSSDFDVAKVVADALLPLSKDRQQRVLRWVGEQLGIVATSPASDAQASTLAAAADTAASAAASAGPARHATDIASFVRAKNPRSDVQFVTVAAYYYRFEAPEGQRLNAISTEVAQNATRLANRDRLASPKSTLNNAKRQGYLDSAARGEFAINTVGENLVARALPASADGGGTARPKRPAKSSKKKAAAKRAKKSR